MIPRYPNIPSLKTALEAQGLEVNPDQSTSSKVVTIANDVNKDPMVITLDAVTKIPRPGPKAPRWTKMPRIGKRRVK